MQQHDLAQLTEAVVRSHNEAAARRTLAGGAGEPHPPLTIAISREAGARGTQLAQELGRRLGWPAYDQQLLELVAEHMKWPTSSVRGMDERAVGWLEETVTALLGADVTPTAYVRHLVAVVHGLGLQGRCILVGRGAGFILPRAWALRVRLVASHEARVRTVAADRHVTSEQAADWIDRTEHSRVQFVKDNFRADAADPLHYHLVLNSGELTIPECARVVIEALYALEAHRATAR